MEIIRHLSDEQLEDMTFESDQLQLKEVLDAIPSWANDMTRRSESFWERQRLAIWASISPRAHHGNSFPLLAWSALAMMVVLAAVLLNAGSAPIPVPRAQVDDPDHQLLIEVERTMQTAGPQALEPAALLAQEIGEHAEENPNALRFKESTHEN